LEFYREGGSDKHLRDISGMLANSSEVIDFPSDNGLSDIITDVPTN